MGIIDVFVLLFFAIGLLFAYLIAGMFWADAQAKNDAGSQGLRQFWKAAVSGYAWPLSVCLWVWSKVRKSPSS